MAIPEKTERKNPQLNFLDGLCRKVAAAYRRQFGEIERMQVKTAGVEAVASKAVKELSDFMASELVRAYPDSRVLVHGKGDVPAKGNVWLLNVVGSLVNYVHGREDVAIQFTYLEDGEVKLSVVDLPLQSFAYIAELGQGARGQSRLRVAGREEVDGSLVQIFSPVTGVKGDDKMAVLFGHMRQHGIHTRVGGNTLLDALQVAQGKANGFVGMNLNSHDVLSAAFFLKESGGYCRDLDGDEIGLASTSLVAGGEKYAPALLKLVQSL